MFRVCVMYVRLHARVRACVRVGMRACVCKVSVCVGSDELSEMLK